MINFAYKRRRKNGFTIVELVIVIAVIAILAGVLIPTFNGVINKAKYSKVYQEANNSYKQDNIEYMMQGYGSGVPNGKIYEYDGFYFTSQDGKLIDATLEDIKQIQIKNIKNIIFLIPDGAGFGTYDIANKLKRDTGGGVKGQATPITHDAIAGMDVSGLYLDEFMIGAVDTYQYYGEIDGATDSTAAGSALLGGYKTNYLVCGLDHEANARANILELARLMGKSTGFITTKCLIDATPCAGNVHLLRRPDQKADYQKDANKQYIVNGIDLFLAYGTDGGYYRDGILIDNSLKARDYGYSLVSDLNTLNNVVNSGARKIFSNIINDCEGEYSGKAKTDYQANHIKYDVHAQWGEDLTLMDLTKAGLKVMTENINDSDGFVLCIEGGAIDNAAEGRNVKEAVGDYLAFDEVFAYCVNYAKLRGDTIVVACPDHDSGGFYSDPNQSTAPYKANTLGVNYDTMDDVINALSNGTMADNTVLAGEVGGHSVQNVPCWLYAPEYVREEILVNLGVPNDACASKVRTGNYFDNTIINEDYKFNNSDLSPAILKALKWISLDYATSQLFYQINIDNRYGTYDVNSETFTFINGETIKRNTNYWTDKGGNKHYFKCGFALYVTNASDDYYGGTGDATSKKFHVDSQKAPGTYPNRFYIPRFVLTEMGYTIN